MEQSETVEKLMKIRNKEDLKAFLKESNFSDEEINNFLKCLGLENRNMSDEDLDDVVGGLPFPKISKNSLIFAGALGLGILGGIGIGYKISGSSTSERDRRLKTIGSKFCGWTSHYQDFLDSAGIYQEPKGKAEVERRMLDDLMCFGNIDIMDDRDYREVCEALGRLPNDYLNFK